MAHADIAVTERVLVGSFPAQSVRRVDARVAAENIQLSIVTNLAAAEPEWRALQDPAGCTVFQTYEWLSAWHRHVGSRMAVTPCIVIGRDVANRALFILPLAVQAAAIARELTWFASDLCDYNAPVLAPDFADRLDPVSFTRVWTRIIKLLQADALTRHDIVRLEKMPVMVGIQPNPMLALAVRLNQSGAYATELSQSWDAFYDAKRSSATRRRDRSKRKNLAEAGEVKLLTAASSSEALDTLAVLVDQKSRTFARHGIRNLFGLPGYLEFFQDIAGNSQTCDLVHVSRLQAGTHTVATNLGLVYGDRYYHVLASYTDGDLSRWGPGAAHLNDLLRYAIERGLNIFDFTIGDERYKRDWCDEAQPLYDHLSATSWRGAFIVTPLIALQKLRRTIKQTSFLWTAVVKIRGVMASLRNRHKVGTAPHSSEGPT
jgi:CelD/BcsL family acetyltransferase involved in cellulose biosynthesis